MDRIIKWVTVSLVVIACISLVYILWSSPVVTGTQQVSSNNNVVYYFYGQGCPHCAKIEPFMENITKKYPDVNIQKLEVWYNQTNQKIYTDVNAAAGITQPPGVPEVVIGNVVLVGEVDIPQNLERYVQAIEKKK